MRAITDILPSASSSLPGIIIGHPENRRVVDFVQALQSMGAPSPIVLPHQTLIHDHEPLVAIADEPRWVRIESVGENASFESELLRLGFDNNPRDIPPHSLREAEFGEVRAPAQWYRGFTRYLRSLKDIFSKKTTWYVLQPPEAIIQLFDKYSAWHQHKKAGIPVPDAVEDKVKHPDELRKIMDLRGWSSVYVKLNSGSSASGLGVFFRSHQERFMTTLLHQNHRWFNSRKILRLSQPQDINRALGFILAEGAHVELSIPKARIDRALFDLRILVVNGEPALTVVRKSSHPITNLHLGGQRGEWSHIRDKMTPELIDQMYTHCRTTAALHGCFHLGLDLLISPGFESYRLIEANAFGDLLPRLSIKGRSVYAHQASLLSGLQ